MSHQVLGKEERQWDEVSIIFTPRRLGLAEVMGDYGQDGPQTQ